MLLEISTTHSPASDLGFLLEKHPARVHDFEIAGGKATVFYSEARHAGDATGSFREQLRRLINGLVRVAAQIAVG